MWEHGDEAKIISKMFCSFMSVYVCLRLSLHENNTHNFPLIPQNRKLSLVEMKCMLILFCCVYSFTVKDGIDILVILFEIQNLIQS